MKVQLQTNSPTRNLGQKINRAEACAKPNFTGAFQVSATMGYEWLRYCSWGYFQPSSIIKGSNFVKMSCDQAHDAEALLAIRKWVHGRTGMTAYYDPSKHSLTETQLAQAKLDLPELEAKPYDPITEDKR